MNFNRKDFLEYIRGLKSVPSTSVSNTTKLFVVKEGTADNEDIILTLEELQNFMIGASSSWESTIVLIRALTDHQTGAEVGCFANMYIYTYSATDSNADDGSTYLKPDNVSGNGRWVKQKEIVEATATQTITNKTFSELTASTVVLASSAKKLESSGVIPTELNVLDGATAGTQVANKAIVANAHVNTGISKVTELHIGVSGSETQVTSTAAELNYCDVTAIGTAQASKAIILDASKDITGINDMSLAGLTSSDLSATTVILASGAKKLESSGVTPTELNVLDGATAGTQVASKAVIADSNINTGISKVTELHIGATGSETQVNSTGAELNLLDGSSTANSTASVAAILNANKELVTNANIGVAGTNCVAVEIGDGKHHVTKITMTDVVLGAPNAGNNSAHGSLIYTFPSGVHLHSHTYFSVGLTVGSVTSDAPDVGVGSVIGTGAIAVLNGTTMEDYVTGITWGTTLDGTTEVQDTVAATAGLFTGISNNASAGVKAVHFNVADGWNAGVTGNLTASGTVVLIWTDIA